MLWVVDPNCDTVAVQISQLAQTRGILAPPFPPRQYKPVLEERRSELDAYIKQASAQAHVCAQPSTAI